jgi:hypothetical protein
MTLPRLNAYRHKRVQLMKKKCTQAQPPTTRRIPATTITAAAIRSDRKRRSTRTRREMLTTPARAKEIKRAHTNKRKELRMRTRTT